jgi:hypothetical protein
MESLRLSPHKNYLAPIKQKAIASGGDLRSMVPVRLAGAEVTEAFWAKLAGLSCPCSACHARNYTVTGSDAIERRTSSVGYS